MARARGEELEPFTRKSDFPPAHRPQVPPTGHGAAAFPGEKHPWPGSPPPPARSPEPVGGGPEGSGDPRLAAGGGTSAAALPPVTESTEHPKPPGPAAVPSASGPSGTGPARDGTGPAPPRGCSPARPPARPAESGCRWRRGYFCTWGGRGGECAETSRLAQERLGPGTPPPRNPRDRDRAPPPAAAARSRSRCVQPAPPRARLKATSVFWQRWGGGGGHFAEGGVEKSLVPSPPHKATSLLGHRIATRRKILHEQGAERKLKKKKKKDFTKIMTAPRPWTVIAQRDLSWCKEMAKQHGLANAVTHGAAVAEFRSKELGKN